MDRWPPRRALRRSRPRGRSHRRGRLPRPPRGPGSSISTFMTNKPKARPARNPTPIPLCQPSVRLGCSSSVRSLVGRLLRQRSRVSGTWFLPSSDPNLTTTVIWMELPNHVIVGQAVVGQAVLAPDNNHRARRARLAKTRSSNPTVGEPRQPDAIRIADHNLTHEVRAAVAETYPRHRRADPPNGFTPLRGRHAGIRTIRS